MRHLAACTFLLFVASWTGCVVKTEDPEPPPPPPPLSEYNPPLNVEVINGVACDGAEIYFESEGASHVPNCSAVEYGTNPPSSGNHYGTWADFRIYDTALPRGFWVHSLEHGAVVISYRCTAEDCAEPAEIEAAKQAVEAAGVDPKCCEDASCTTGSSRVILTPDPLLDVAWAASAWQFTLRADCFDAGVFQEFINRHRGLGPEDVCDENPNFSESACG
jgi:hypothetical protein